MADESKDACCPDGSWPALVLDDSRDSLAGKEVALTSGLNTYQVPAPDGDCKKAVVVIHDVHGFSGGRIKGVCDSIAKAGFFVVMPDLYGDSDGVNKHGGFMAPTGKAFLQKYTWERLEKNLKEVQAEVLTPKGMTSVGAIGFCWGGWVVFHMSGANMISAGAICHPSLQAGAYLFEEKVEELTAGVTCPIQLCPAGNDPDYVKTGGDVPKALAARDIFCGVHEFPDMKHGWVPRGDATDDTVARDVKKAIEVCTEFFTAKM